jgi:hypothetical protein
MRLLSPDHACVSADAPSGQRYDGTVVEVTNPGDVRALRTAGYTAAGAAVGPTRARGYRCTGCGFKGWFTTCGRCGGVCARD